LIKTLKNKFVEFQNKIQTVAEKQRKKTLGATIFCRTLFSRNCWLSNLRNLAKLKSLWIITSETL